MASDLKSSGKGGYKPKPKRKRQTGREAPRAGPGPPQPKPAPPPRKRDIKAGEKSVVSQGRPYRGAPPAKPKTRRKAVPIVTEHTRGQANAIDRRQPPTPFQGRQGPVARPSEGHGKAFAEALRGVGVLGATNLEGFFAPPVGPTAGYHQRKMQEASALNLGVGKALLHQAVHDIQHPTDPLAILDFAALASGVIGGSARIAEASRAASIAAKARELAAARDARAAEINANLGRHFRPKGIGYETGLAARTAPLETPGQAVARALTTRAPANALTPARLLPEGAAPGTRRVALPQGGHEQFRLSPHPAVAAVQHAIDRFSELHPQTPVVGAVPRIARQGRKTKVILENRAAAEAANFLEATRGIKTGSPEDVALGRVVNYDPDSAEHALELLDARIATHEKEARKPVAEPKVTTNAAGHRIVKQPEGTISPATKKNLEATIDELRAARPYVERANARLKNAVEHGVDLSHLTTKMLVEGGHITAETAERARHYGARFASGAHFMSPSEAVKKGAELRGEHRDLVKLEKSTKREVSRTMRSQIEAESLVGTQAREANRAAQVAARSRKKARDAVDAAQRKVDRLAATQYGSQFRYAAEGKQAGTLVRHTRELRAARRELQQAKQALRIEVRKGKQVAARQRLAGENQRKARAAGQEARTAAANTLGQRMSVIGAGKRQIEGDLRDLQDKVGTIVGAEDVRAGERAAFVGSNPRTPKLTQRIGGGVPLGKQRKLVHQTKGTLFTQGREDLSGKRAIANRFMITAKRVVQDKIAREKLDKMSLPLKDGDHLLPRHVLYNPEGYKVARQLREVPPDAILEGATPAELEKAVKELHEYDQSVHQHVFPSEADYAQMSKDERRGLRQIDERIAKSYAPPPALPADGAAGVARDLLDATNNITRGALIYLNPSYIPRNYVGNLAFLALHQGVFGVKNLTQASRLLGTLHPETLSRIDHEIGPGGARGLFEASTGAHRLAMDRLTELQNRVADQGPRRAAWIHEAATRGYDTDAKIHRLLTSKDANTVEVLNQISLDARRAMVDFGDLTPFERKVVSRVIFIYPWLKGATRYGKDLLVDRPVSAAIAAHVLAARNDLQRRHGIGRIDPLLGHDIIPIGPSRMVNGQRIQPVTNWQSINPVGQALDVAQAGITAARGGGASSEALSQFLQPGLVAAGKSVFQDRGNLKSVPLTFAKELVGTPTRPRFPLGQTAQILFAGKPSPEEIAKRMYVPEHGVKAAVEQALLGSARGRQLNVTKARASRMTASEKKIAKLKIKRDAQLASIRKYKVKITPKGRKDLREAYDRQIAREEARAQAGITATNKGAAKGQEWQRDALVVDTRLALRRGWIPPRFRNDAKWVIANAHKMEFDALHGDDVKSMLAAIDELAYGGGSAGPIAETAGQIHEKAGHK